MNFAKLLRTLGTMAASPAHARQVLRNIPTVMRGAEFARRWAVMPQRVEEVTAPDGNPLREFFEARTTGAGIWKWQHYFDIYHRHLGKFVNRQAHLLEIGVYSGGSLDMWQQYLGAGAVIHGVDIAPECAAYARENVHIMIGDQEDRDFWARFRAAVPTLDAVIDDGGHTEHQQIVTLEELLPHLRPGGVYLCEDVAGTHHGFAAYVSGLVAQLNAFVSAEGNDAVAEPTPFQQSVYSVHFYPFVVVIERATAAPREFSAPKHGTEWQPFEG